MSYQAANPAKKPATITFHKGLHCFVHTVVKMLQHKDDLIVAPVGDYRTYRTDLEGRKQGNM